MARRIATVVVIAAALVVAAAFATNPAPEQHRARIRQDVAERSPLASVFGAGVLTAFASTYHSVGVGSYTVVNGKLTSLGAFGTVVVVQ